MLKDMVGTRDDLGPGDQGPSSNTSKWSSNFMEEIESFSSGSHKEINKETHRNSEQDMLSPQTASQVFWCTGMYSEPIPNGFYSVIPEKKLKEQFDNIPALDELRALEIEGFRADVILVESDQDKKLSMLKQLTSSLVKGLNSNPATMIKKIAALVCDFYKGPISESPSKSVAEETSNTFEDHRVQLLGQIKHGSCRPRAILFKVLADTVGLESQLVVGLPMPNDGGAEFLEPYRHVSVIVVLNSVELLVDLIRFPGQLLPPSTKAVFMTHVSATGESDSAENDSCDSPLEPNSPLHGFSERFDLDSTERDDILQFHRKNEASSNASLRHAMMRWATVVDRELSSSHSEPNIATAFWRRSRRKVIADQRTASISPEHPLFRARGRSMLSGDRKDFRDFSDDTSTSRSTGASTSESRLMRRRSISIPEIGDDIVRAVRAMNDKMKQNRISRERGDDVNGNRSSDIQKNDQLGWQRAVSLPSSPHEYRGENSKRGGPSEYTVNDDLVSAWNKVLDSYGLNNKPLLPYQEWNIDFAELTVGIRIGIGFFGEVFRGVWNGTDVAIKVFLEQDLTTENMEDFCNEISILSRLRHPNVILFLGACTKPPRLSMVTEYMEMGSLYSLIHLSGYKKKLSWRRRLKMLRDICRGLMCIHRMKIVHRDLKSANCLVNKHWMVKICDFGLSRILTGERTAMMDSPSAGTSEWMAPELFRNEPLTEKCDIFSLGVIMWELCTLNRPWEGVPPEKVIYAVSTEGLRLEIPEGPLSRLISDCWAEPLERPSCEEILSRLIDCEFSLC